MKVAELVEKVNSMSVQIQAIKQDLNASLSELSKTMLNQKIAEMEAELNALNDSDVIVGKPLKGGK